MDPHAHVLRTPPRAPRRADKKESPAPSATTPHPLTTFGSALPMVTTPIAARRAMAAHSAAFSPASTNASAAAASASAAMSPATPRTQHELQKLAATRANPSGLAILGVLAARNLEKMDEAASSAQDAAAAAAPASATAAATAAAVQMRDLDEDVDVDDNADADADEQDGRQKPPRRRARRARSKSRRTQRDLAEAYEEPATPEALHVHEDPDSPVSRERGSAARHNSSSSAGASARIDKSLSGLTENFIHVFKEEVGHEISLDHAAKRLGVERRRIYDIVNVFEALEIVGRKAKNTYVWRGLDNLDYTLAKLKALAPSHIDSPPRTGLSDATNSRRGGAASRCAPPSPKKDRALGVLAQRFIMLFMERPNTPVALDDAAERLIFGVGCPEAKRSKTKVRRLYDISNILMSLHMITKVSHDDRHQKRTSFSWVYDCDLSQLPEIDAKHLVVRERSSDKRRSMKQSIFEPAEDDMEVPSQWKAERSKPNARAKVQTRVKSEEPSLPAKRIKRETDETPRNAGSWVDAKDVSAAAASPTTFPVPAAPSRSLPFYAMPPPSHAAAMQYTSPDQTRTMTAEDYLRAFGPAVTSYNAVNFYQPPSAPKVRAFVYNRDE